MNVEKLELGPLGTNCYIVHKEGLALIFDPGGDRNKLIQFISEKELKPVAICLTHAHFDHIGAVDDIRDFYGINVYVHELEREWLSNPELNGSGLFPVGEVKCKDADQYVHTGEWNIEGFAMEVRHVPGHSPGGVIYIFHKDHLIIGGDCLFHGGIGRTDLFGGDMNQLLTSIREQFFTLPDDYLVLPGHGSNTSIGFEQNNNPFL
ncbi:MBL fold metallo-hydrolase [Aquibacillus koreensis]|uniref:MBL fold metallo-hydrolase n=1 Tax=Aquibacillus koreensis TaxID=279446 RepID=A0A9X3WFU4_9BACI|nr:MBL fold metallo-hydrolase [Aquibacillus koreensis]MCT2537554.1 MBL fold metallo-hydrolase [Aquibacillus koreensis]MDC3419000.1 MBL fold metallo-hydrolase [Aquibacillus koreensis]